MGFIIDVSEHNTITDWAACKKDVELMIIRIGYRGSVNDAAHRENYAKITEDKKASYHLDGVKKYGIPYTVYFFTTAITDAEAVSEAAWIRDRIKGLQLSGPVFNDTENVLSNRSARADKLSKQTRTHLLRVLTDHLIADGIPCGIYSYRNWLNSNVNMSEMDPRVIKNTWVADAAKSLGYTGTACLWQYGQRRFPWAASEIDVNKRLTSFYMEADKKEEKKMAYYRSVIVEKAASYLGTKDYSAKHKEIIAAYNSQKSLPRGYKMTVNDAWCATFVSAIAIMCGYTAIIPTECSCGYLVDKAKKMGIWQENDAYVPKPGDILLYDWDDSGSGDDTGWPDHVGYVEKVSGNSITTIEGNAGNGEVKRISLKVNQKNIRGFITPKYTAAAPEAKAKKVQLAISLPEIRLGDKGEHVKLWQFLIGIDQTGVYDTQAQADTKKWQSKNGKAVDGWIGKGCWTKALKNKGWM